jgi:mono/diheme cytochrome c family protein
MKTFARRGCPFMSIVFGRLCVLLLLSGLGTWHVKGFAQSTPASPDGRAPGGSNLSSPDRGEADRAPSRTRQLYRDHCINCHDTDGRGEPTRDTMKAIPDFTVHEWHRARSDEHLVRSIREGKGSMPAMKRKLREHEVVQLVSLVREFRGGRQVIPEEPEPEPVKNSAKSSEGNKMTARENSAVGIPQSGSAAVSAHVNQQAGAGRGIFQRFCTSCHGTDGRGTTLRDQTPSIPDFTSQVWQGRRSPPQLSTTILEGKGTAMPAFRGKLNEAQLRDLVAYLRAFAPQPASASIAPDSDFKRRFGQLTQELDELKRQYRDLLPK